MGTVPDSWLLYRALHAAGRRNGGAVWAGGADAEQMERRGAAASIAEGARGGGTHPDSFYFIPLSFIYLLGAHRYCKLERLPRDAGTVPDSWLLFRYLHAAGRRDGGAVRGRRGGGRADGAEEAAASIAEGGSGEEGEGGKRLIV